MSDLRRRADPFGSMVLDAFGTRVGVTFLRGLPAADASHVYAAARTCWSRCLLDAVPVPSEPEGAVLPMATHRYMARLRMLDPAAQPCYEASDGRGRTAYVLADDATEFAQQLTTQIVVRAIGNRRGAPLMLHAGAVAAPSGAVHVLAAPSGTGKTTAMLRLCSPPGRWGYVTDETVAIEEDGMVVPFPKPLSVIETPHRPKTQRSPEDLGLMAPPRQLQVASISVLRRDPTRSSATRRRLETTEALQLLAPQTSGLAAMSRGLVRLAALCDRVGGVGIIEYGEAEQLSPLLAGLDRDAVESEPVGSGWRPGRNWRRGALEGDAVRASPAPTLAAQSPDGDAESRWRRVEVDDSLDLGDGESTAMLTGDRLSIASRFGVATWEACAAPRSAAEVAHALQEEFGPHPQARALAQQALESLAEAGLVRAGRPR